MRDNSKRPRGRITRIVIILNRTEAEGEAVRILRKYGPRIKSRAQVKRKGVKPHTPRLHYNPLIFTQSAESKAEQKEAELMRRAMGITEAEHNAYLKRLFARKARIEAARELRYKAEAEAKALEEMTGGKSLEEVIDQLNEWI